MDTSGKLTNLRGDTSDTISETNIRELCKELTKRGIAIDAPITNDDVTWRWC